ncbi:MAG TPA: carboxypeptidase regulatory-like domain-containing protein [Acidobacteriaceae bacterium]
MRVSELVRRHRSACQALLSPVIAVLMVVTGAFAALPAYAQFRASIHGVVTDPQGAAIPGAKLTLTDTATNISQNATSDAQGVYTFNALPPSKFKLSATASGFSNKVLDNLAIIPEQPNAINVQLGLQGSAESIDVTSGAVPALDTETATISGTVTDNQIQHLPSFGRDVLTLAQLAPGVLGDGGMAAGGGVRSLPGSNQAGTTAGDGVTKTENAPQVIGAGVQPSNNNVLIDGISASSVTWGGSTVITPTEDSVQSVKVSSNNYDAEYGRFTGTNIQITSKGGSNQIHGSLFFTAQRPGLNAYQRWNGPNSVGPAAAGLTPQARNLQRDTQRFNQYGGSVGFPIWKDKLFGFFAYETLRAGGISYSTGLYETPAFLKMAPSGSNASKLLTFPGEGVQQIGLASMSCQGTLGIPEGPFCHYIAGQGLDVGSPLATALGTYDPSRDPSDSTKPGYGGGLDGVADLAAYALQAPNSKQADQYYGRADAQITKNDRLSGMIYWQPVKSYSINGPIRTDNSYLNDRINNAFTGLYNHTFAPNLLNEARVNAAGWRWNEITSNPGVPFGFPSMSFSDTRNMFPSNPNSFAPPTPSVFDQWTYGYQDILTWVHGRHNSKMGGTLTRLYYLNQNTGAARPTFNFGNLWNYLNDAPYQESGNFNPSTGALTSNRQDNRNNFWGAFYQDDWKIARTLTVNLGLRYDYLGPYYDKGNNLRTVVLGAGSAMVTGLSLRTGGNEWNAQKGNFGPQVGFAWNPEWLEHKFVLRGGFGLNYNQNEMAITAQSIGNPGNTVGFTFCCKGAAGTTNTGGSIQYVVSSDPHAYFGYPGNPNAKTTFDANGLPLTGTTGLTAFDANVKSTQTYHYSLDTEYSIGHGWVAELGYQASVNHHLLVQQDMNVIAAASGYALNPKVSRVGYYGNKGNANYNAMLLDVRHNFAHGFQMEGQYTWAKSMDNGSQPYYQDTYPYNLAYSYGRSDYYVKNAYRVFGMYQPRFFHNGWLHSLADGWTLTGIYNYHTGFPWTPTYSTSFHQFYTNSGQGTLRPAAYLGTGGHDLSNAAFMGGNNNTTANATKTQYTKNFPNGPFAYFTLPTVSTVASTGYNGTVVPLPTPPGVARNSFDGPHFSNMDASLAKGFHIPKLPVLGENASFEVRADAFNLFNQIELNGVSSSIGSGGSNTGQVLNPNYYFGQSTSALGGRVIDLQARFSF